VRRALILAAAACLPLLAAAPLPAAQGTPQPIPGATAIPGVETFEGLSFEHVEGRVAYPQTPPVGGPHAPVWQNCGFYDRPVGDEQAVHSLEHGAVWITYRPDLPADQIAILERRAERGAYVLVSPYPDLPAPVVASAWGAQVRLEGADDRRLTRFVRAYAGNGPEPGAPCTGGTDATLPFPAATPRATPAASPAPTPAAGAAG